MSLIGHTVHVSCNAKEHFLSKCFSHISKFIQERTDNADKRRQDIEKANKKHAELKKKRDNTTNSRK